MFYPFVATGGIITVGLTAIAFVSKLRAQSRMSSSNSGPCLSFAQSQGRVKPVSHPARLALFSETDYEQ